MMQHVQKYVHSSTTRSTHTVLPIFDFGSGIRGLRINAPFARPAALDDEVLESTDPLL